MNQSKKSETLSQLQEQICKEKNVSSNTMRKLLDVVGQYGDSHRAVGLLDELLDIIKEDFDNIQNEIKDR